MARKKQRLRREAYYNSFQASKEIAPTPLIVSDNSSRIEEIKNEVPHVEEEEEVVLQESPFDQEQNTPELVVEEPKKVKKTSTTKPKAKAKPKVTAKAKPKAKRKTKAPAKG